MCLACPVLQLPCSFIWFRIKAWNVVIVSRRQQQQQKRHCVSLLFTRTAKVILNTCLWSTAPDDCQLSPTLSIWPFDSHTHTLTHTHTHTHTHGHTHWVTEWLLARGSHSLSAGFSKHRPVYVCVTSLETIWLVRGPTNVCRMTAVRVCVFKTHTHMHTHTCT